MPRTRRSNLTPVPAAPERVRAVAYTRVSTDEQVHSGTSLEGQRRHTTDFVAQQGWDLVESFVEEGVSGKLDPEKRPQMARLLAMARAGEVDVVVATAVDRFARRLRHGLNLRHALLDLGVRVIFSTTPDMDEMHFQMLGAFAEKEAELIRERTMGGTSRIVGDGFWPGGTPPFGFDVVPNGHRKSLVINEEEAETARLMVFCFVDRRLSTQNTATHLNAMGRMPRKSPRWNSLSVRRTLMTGSFFGEWVYAKGDEDVVGTKRGKGIAQRQVIAVPEILPPDRQVLLDDALDRTSIVRRASDQIYPLSYGRMIAPCGSAYSGITRRDRGNKRTYRCWNSRAENHEARGGCDCKRLDANLVERFVWDHCVRVLSDPESLLSKSQEYEATRGAQGNLEVDQIKRLRKAIADGEKKIDDTIYEFAQAGKAALATKAIAKLEQELESNRKWLAGMEAHRTRSSAQMTRFAEIAELGKQLFDRSDEDMTLEEMTRIFEMVDVKLEVLGFIDCVACNSKGRLMSRTDFVADENVVRTVGSKELAEAIGKSRPTVQRLAQQGQIPYTDAPDGKRLYNVDEVKAALETRVMSLDCTSCVGRGFIPKLRLSGEVEVLPSSLKHMGLPFLVEAIGASESA